MAFQSGGFQPADAAPDDGFAAAIVPVDSAEHFTAFAANDNLRQSNGCSYIVQMLPIISFGNMAMDMDSGKIHFISAWSNDDEEDSRAKEKTVHF